MTFAYTSYWCNLPCHSSDVTQKHLRSPAATRPPSPSPCLKGARKILLHSLSNILNCKLMSLYPQRGGATVRRYLHRWTTPFPKPSPFQWSQMAIMWTSTQGMEQEAKDWRVNHFVVCVPHMAYSLSRFLSCHRFMNLKTWYTDVHD